MPPTLASIDPADGAVAVIVGTPVVVRLQNTGSDNFEVVETDTDDFAAGTLTDTVASDGALQLESTLAEDFEAHDTGKLPAGWTLLTGSGVTVETLGGGQALKSIGSGTRAWQWDAVGTAVDRHLLVKIRRSGASHIKIFFRFTGTYGGSSYWYHVSIDTADNTLRFYRGYPGGYASMGSVGITYTDATDYWLRFEVAGTTIRARWWDASGAEPGTWTLETTDANVTAAGSLVIEDSANGTTWYDDIALVGEGDTYAASGDRISPEYDLTDVGDAGSAVIEFDADVPDDTTLTVTTRIDGGSWSSAYASGDSIEGITFGDDLTGVVIEVRAELATSDSAVTPTLSEVRLVFRPVNPALVEVEVAGVACTVADGTLAYWNDSRIVGSALVLDESDLYFGTEVPWWAGEGETIDIVVSYDGVEVDTITVTVEDLGPVTQTIDGYWVAWEATPEWRSGEADGYYSVLDYASSLITADGHFAVLEPLSVLGDGWYWVAHNVEFDAPGALVVGEPVVCDAPSALVIQGWTRDDGPGAMVIQGWLRDDGAGALVVANDLVADAPAAAVVGEPLASDAPGAGVVYEAAAALALEVQVIDAATAAALAAAGVVVPS